MPNCSNCACELTGAVGQESEVAKALGSSLCMNCWLDAFFGSDRADEIALLTRYPDTGEQAFLDADHSKLDAIEANATADQTGAEIKTAYEGEAETNAFTDAEKTKLGTVDTNADVTGDNVPQAHSVASHNDTTGTGAELEELTDGSETTLHSHAGGGAALTVAETEVFSGTSPDPAAWTDLDLSAVVGENHALVMLRFFSDYGYDTEIVVRPNGETEVTAVEFESHAFSGCEVDSHDWTFVMTWTDDAGIIEWYYPRTGLANTTIDIVAYIK